MTGLQPQRLFYAGRLMGRFMGIFLLFCQVSCVFGTMSPSHALAPTEGREDKPTREIRTMDRANTIVLDCSEAREGNYRYYSYRRHRAKSKHTCEISDHARGMYRGGSNYCIFEFYSNTASETACATNDRIPTARRKDYINYWPDECLYDFPRCYDLANEKDVYQTYFCQKKWKMLNFPNITHVSVDCSLDVQTRQRERSMEFWQNVGVVILVCLFYLVVGVACFWCCRRCIRELRATARAHNENRDMEDYEFTVVSVMCCGYWCIVKQALPTTRAERSGLTNASVNRSVEMT